MDTVRSPKGFLLIASLIVLTMLIIIVSFYLSIIQKEVVLQDIVQTSPPAYYLAETGIQDAIWRLQNDAAWIASFETDPNWSATFSKNNVFVSGDSYNVHIQNQALANAIITATSSIPARSTVTQRVIETNVFKGLGNMLDGIAMFSNSKIDSTGSELQINGGDVFSNENINLEFYSDWLVEGNASSVQQVEVSANSALSARQIYDADSSPPPEPLAMPAIDFDSDDPNSYLSRATQVYTSGEWLDLMNSTSPIVLTGIHYVQGNAHIKKRQYLILNNGILVADGNITVGNGYADPGEGALVDVNNTDPLMPTGLIAKGKVVIGGQESNVNVEGVVYSGTSVEVRDSAIQDVDLVITGGLITQGMLLETIWDPAVITLNQDFIDTVLGTPTFSPIIQINYWEEEY